MEHHKGNPCGHRKNIKILVSPDAEGTHTNLCSPGWAVQVTGEGGGVGTSVALPTVAGESSKGHDGLSKSGGHLESREVKDPVTEVGVDGQVEEVWTIRKLVPSFIRNLTGQVNTVCTVPTSADLGVPQ